MIDSIFFSRLTRLLGDDTDAVVEALAHEHVGSLRINHRFTWDQIAEEFLQKNIVLTPIHGFEGIYTFSRDDEYAIKGTDAFYQGRIYLQSLTSLLSALILAPESGNTVLDVCAAPGSKTTQIAEMLAGNGTITALEKNPIRYDKLCYNLRLQSVEGVEPIRTDAIQFLQKTNRMWNKILLDAPCSAEGRIFLKNEKSYGFWSVDNIIKKSTLQSELIRAAYAHLAPGGTLVYSTCTLAPEENEGVIAELLASAPSATLEDVNVPEFFVPYVRSGICEWEGNRYPSSLQKTIRILPSYYTEGFYIAKIRNK